jgi:predicted 2-oxoglutarate/Fe(II)-dependent dioxygenase YbiX/peroxiredoxin
MNRIPMIGEPVPWFHAQALDGNARYAFDTAAGRWIVMLFAGQAGRPELAPVLELLAANRDLFDDANTCFFGVTIDPADVADGRIAQLLPGVRWFLDYDHAVSKAYGAIGQGESGTYPPYWLLLDPLQRVVLHAPLAGGPSVLSECRRLAREPRGMPAPVLVAPRILSPALCRRLIDVYERQGGEESGFMREIDGVTTAIVDHGHKRRADCTIDDEELITALKSSLFHMLRPLVQRAFQFEATRIERWIVACYDGGTGGYFRPHRDNTTKGTAHRKFAVTINLNAEEYEGGDLCFPEFGSQTYRAPTGGAVVFSCSLLHEARPVTKGRRYAFLPFLYDDAGARLRERNLPHVAPELQSYRSGLPPEESSATFP